MDAELDEGGWRDRGCGLSRLAIDKLAHIVFLCMRLRTSNVVGMEEPPGIAGEALSLYIATTAKMR
jgi:hypothetical protein